MKTIGHILSTFYDGLLLILPLNPKPKSYKFAFIVHPRTRKDLQRQFPFAWLLPSKIIDTFTKYYWPIKLSTITGLKSLKDGTELEGYIISVLPTAYQMVENRDLALKRITQACLLAQKRGATLIGLGGLTSSFSKGGLDLLSKVKINITTGHAYTSYNVTQNVLALADYMNLDKQKVNIGIVGAAGSVGSTCAKLLAREGFKNIKLVDLERKKHFFIDLIKDIFQLNPLTNVTQSHQISDISNCDFVIAATNAPEALITSKDLKWGAIVVDDAQPSDVHSDVFERKDVLVVEAGVTFTPGIKNNFNFGLKNREDNFCCLAEVFILAANEWDEHYVINRASLSHVDEIGKWGNDMNFKIGKFQNFRELITEEKLQFVKNCLTSHEL